MSFIDRILAQKGRRGELADRIAGKNSQANLSFNRARGAAANVAASTAARAADGGMNAAAANRLASQGEQAAVAQAAQQQAAGRAGEVARAEDELARMREARSNFGRQLFGGVMKTGGAIASQLGIGGGQEQPQGAGMAAPAAQVAGTALAGPVGGALAGNFAQQLFGGPRPTDDQLLAASPQPQQAAPAPAGFMQALMGQPAAPVAPAATQGVAGQLAAATMPAGGIPPGMTPEQYAEWLRRQNGGL